MPDTQFVQCDNQELIELHCMMGKRVVQSSYLGSKRRVGSEAKVDDAGMGHTRAKHEVTKVTVVGDENPAFGLCEYQHLQI